MPLFVSFTILWTLNVIQAIYIIKQSRTIREDAKMMHVMTDHAIAAVTFANALADRGVTIPCDDCGNGMTTDDQISVIRKRDGGTYIGHASHQRHVDWGPPA